MLILKHLCFVVLCFPIRELNSFRILPVKNALQKYIYSSSYSPLIESRFLAKATTQDTEDTDEAFEGYESEESTEDDSDFLTEVEEDRGDSSVTLPAGSMQTTVQDIIRKAVISQKVHLPRIIYTKMFSP